MRIPTNTLPSGGQYKKSTYIELNPLKYKDIVIHDKSKAVTEVDIYINEIETCLSKIEDWRSLLLFDIDSLIFTLKYISVSNKPEVKMITSCDTCGRYEFQLKISNLSFTNISELLKIKSVNLNNTEFLINHNVTIGEFYELLQKLKRWNLDIPREELFLIAYLIRGENINQVYDTIMNSVKDDIVVIKELANKLVSESTVTVKCPTCGKESVVRLKNLITEIFPTLYLNTDISSKITYFK